MSASTPLARRVRRAPLTDRIQAYLNPWDFLLWLSEEINSNEWEEACRAWSTPAGIVINVLFMLARANVGNTSSFGRGGDDVFGDYDERHGTGWLAWFVSAQSEEGWSSFVMRADDCHRLLSSSTFSPRSPSSMPTTPSAANDTIVSSKHPWRLLLTRHLPEESALTLIRHQTRP